MSANYGPATENDPRMLTADGQPIEDGKKYWNYYDLEWVKVEFGDSMTLSPTGKYWDGWFNVHTVNADETLGSRYTLNGERMAARETRP